MKIGAIIQARTTSTRLPNKVLLDIAGKPALQHIIERLRQSKKLETIIVATTTNETDNLICDLCDKLNCFYFRGSEDDVLTRVLGAAKAYDIDIIVEVTGDCELIDWSIIDQLISMYCNNDVDYCSNVLERTFPRGYDCQVFGTKLLERVNREVDNPIDRQHVSTWIYKNPKNKGKFKLLGLKASKELNRPDIEVTLDTEQDLELMRWLFDYGKEYRIDMTCQQVINAIDFYPDKYKKVAEIQRKDYLEELKEAYKSIEGAKTNEQVQCIDNWSGRTGSISRHSGKPKRK
jgi:spore coat polysaccharide biosynthesis protein SpsF